MKSIRLLLFLLLVTNLIHANSYYRGPSTHEPGLLMTINVVALSQSDFDSGPYRIQQPGYYYLTENILFEPNPTKEVTRTDKPRTGWFTALSVECDNVIIDLNTRTFEVSENFLNGHDFKVFSLIEFNNSPFQHLIFAFTDETKLKVAHNVIIKNGTLGRSSHHGIHGNNNTNVQIYDLVIRDWEVAGISLNGLKSGEIKHVSISGVEHAVPFTGLLALLQSTRVVLEDLVNGGDTQAQSYIDALDMVIADDSQNGKNHPTGTHDGNTYGLFINRTVDVGPIVTHCDDKTANCITIEDVTVCNIKTSIIETVAIGDMDGNRLKGDLFGVMRWVDAYPNGTFAPNAILKAQVYGVHKNNPSKLPASFADDILSSTPSESMFLSQVKPIFNSDFAGHTNKGAFGIRVDCGHGVTIQNCHVMGIENIGPQGSTLSTLSGGSNYSLTVGRYTGNDVYGISLAASHNCAIVDCAVTECSSDNGYVFGIVLQNNSDANKIVHTISSDHFAALDNPDDAVNPSSVVYSFNINNQSNSNRLINCVSQSLESLRFCYGFYVYNVKDTLVEGCLSSCHRVTSSNDLDEVKKVAGFASVGSECTKFKLCESREMRVEGEDNYDGKSASKSIGFMLVKSDDGTDDKYGVITESTAECNNGGAGKAYGIYLNDVKEAMITKNTLANNHKGAKKGKGYGLYKDDSDDSTLILQNIAYGNSSKNYRAKYDQSKQKLPVIEMLYGKVKDDEYIHNPYYNISFEYK